MTRFTCFHDSYEAARGLNQLVILKVERLKMIQGIISAAGINSGLECPLRDHLIGQGILTVCMCVCVCGCTPQCSWQTPDVDGIPTLSHFHLTCVVYFSVQPHNFCNQQFARWGYPSRCFLDKFNYTLVVVLLLFFFLFSFIHIRFHLGQCSGYHCHLRLLVWPPGRHLWSLRGLPPGILTSSH